MRPAPALLPVLALALCAAALTGVAAAGALVPGERPLAEAVQETPHGAALEWPADFFSYEFVAYPLALIAAAAAWRARNYPLALTVLLVLLSLALNPLLKELIRRPRPTADDLIVREHAPSYGYPSGHTMTATLLYGYVAAVVVTLGRRARWTAAVAAAYALLVVLIAWDRVYEGAHWPSDTAGGAAIGALLLVAAWWLPRAVRDRRAQRPPAGQRPAAGRPP